MRIWVFNQYASTPDQPTTGAYFLLKSLADKGVDVTVFAAGFNYYRRKEIRLGSSLLTKAVTDGNLTFQWLRTTPTSGRAITRMINMISYLTLSVAVALFKKNKPDIVIGVCPHPLAGLAAWIVAALTGARFMYEIRDIWPESLTEGKIIREGGIVARCFSVLQNFLYARAEKIISVLPALDKYLGEIGVPTDKFLWIPNGVVIRPEDLLDSHAPANSVFTAMYIGGHSKYHALDDLLDAAKILQDRNQTDIKIVLIGDGSEKPRLMGRARFLELKNTEFRDAVPRTEISRAVAEASCLVITSRSMPIHRYGISPNKLCDAMLAARPIIMALPASNDLVTETGAGITVPPQDALLLADAIVTMRDTPVAEREAMGANGQRYAIANFDAGNLADKLLKVLNAA